jgi:hypothetical protein
MTTPASSCDRVSLAPVANEMGFRCGRQTFFSLRPDVLILSCGMMALWGVVARCQIRKRRKGCVCELKPILFGVSRARRLDLTPRTLPASTIRYACREVHTRTGADSWLVSAVRALPSFLLPLHRISNHSILPFHVCVFLGEAVDIGHLGRTPDFASFASSASSCAAVHDYRKKTCVPENSTRPNPLSLACLLALSAPPSPGRYSNTLHFRRRILRSRLG